MKNFILIFLFTVSCSPKEFLIRQLTPGKTELTEFFLEPKNSYEKIETEAFDASWMHSAHKTTLSYRSYCYPISIPFEFVEEIIILSLKSAEFIDDSLNLEDFIEDSQSLDIDYENKNWMYTYTDSSSGATGVVDVTLLKAENCFYSIHFVSEQTIYKLEKPVLENFINNFKP